MSVSSIGQSSSDYWLQRMLASYGQKSSTSSQSSALGLLSQGSDATDDTSATSSGSSSSKSSSVGSFNDILTALLAGKGSLSYDMETGTLTTSEQGEDGQMPPSPSMEGAPGEGGGHNGGLTRNETVTTNADGSTTTTATLTDADGKQVRTEKTAANADGSFTTTIATTDPSGKTSTRTVTGKNTDAGFLVSDTLTASDGTVLESGTELTASNGSVTRTMTRNGPDGGSLTESESYDADGLLVSSSSTATPPAKTAASTGATTSAAASGKSGAPSSSKASGGSDSSSDKSDNITTVTMTFTSEGIQETTTVTDKNGKIVNQSTKEMPFDARTKGQSYGSLLQKGKGFSDYLDMYAANRYGAAQSASSGKNSGSGGFSAQA
ncbi:hypothetical protein [Solidesulfovibrio sp.]|uniref:hypothetical protein n=1 Tax=Solidesulfovibrio sp. TaxID=2910990 RepID=UPI000ED3DCE6|nr:hypothetical protein [Solidesulfovibrio sp.]MEA5088613.1 hypothetical protein [Solidesulfovibrio sp.]HCR11843.1 hypothetical protein [Desulfovibrio sp.]HML61537.1 hypothetical protein [Solidesulfovibrio sp.]